MSATIQFSADPKRIAERWSEKQTGKVPNEEVIVESELFGEKIAESWNQNQEIVLSTIENITGLSVSGEFTVFVLPPILEQAQYIDANTIEWGYGETYKNSTVIGIAHELIHCITHDFYSSLSDDHKWTFHALVYLSADEEIRFVLNGKSDYFDSPTIGDYHERLIEEARAVLPLWKERLVSPEHENLIDFFGKIKRN